MGAQESKPQAYEWKVYVINSIEHLKPFPGRPSIRQLTR